MADKTYEDGVREALDLADYHYFGRRIGDEERTRKNMRAVMVKADARGTAVPAFWNFFKELKADIGNLINVSEEDFIEHSKSK